MMNKPTVPTMVKTAIVRQKFLSLFITIPILLMAQSHTSGINTGFLVNE